MDLGMGVVVLTLQHIGIDALHKPVILELGRPLRLDVVVGDQ